MKNKGKLLISIGVIILISSLAFMGFTHIRMIKRANEIQHKKEDFVKKVKQSNEGHSKFKDEDFNGVLGFVEIEKIKLLLPIYKSTSDKELRDGVGIVETTGQPTNQLNTVSVLAGHRGGYNGKDTFLKIDQLKNGDIVKVTDRKNVYRYKVTGRTIIEPTDWTKFNKEQDKAKLILMSCHPYPTNTHRMLVFTELIRTDFIK